MANVIALVLGTIYMLVGLVGFVLNPSGGLLLGIFAVNPFHHAFHIALGLSGLVAARWHKGRLYAQVSGMVLLFLGLMGLGATALTTALIATPGANILTDNLLHLVTGT